MIAAFVVVLVGASVAAQFYFTGASRSAISGILPTGCVKPANGFLVILNSDGYNDSIAHGAPSKWWPVINVQQGQTVNLTVCDADTQAHGFQISHYYDNSIVTLVPGEVLRVSFVANRIGEFRIYCDIFCAVHIFMQSGLLNVTSA